MSKGPAAPAGLTYLTSDAAPGHRAHCGHLLRSHQCVRIRAIQRHAIVPKVITYNEAISACAMGQQHQQALQ